MRQFEGHYAYRDDLTVYLVAQRDRLVAVLGDGKYSLRRVAPDTFENGAGDRIPILRDAGGRVVAFQERGDIFRRLAAMVPAEVRSLLEPRADVTSYRYAVPAAADDGIPVKAAGEGTLSLAVAEQLVQGVMDGRSSLPLASVGPPGAGRSRSIAASVTSSARGISGRAIC